MLLRKGEPAERKRLLAALLPRAAALSARSSHGARVARVAIALKGAPGERPATLHPTHAPAQARRRFAPTNAAAGPAVELRRLTDDLAELDEQLGRAARQDRADEAAEPHARRPARSRQASRAALVSLRARRDAAERAVAELQAQVRETQRSPGRTVAHRESWRPRTTTETLLGYKSSTHRGPPLQSGKELLARARRDRDEARSARLG